MLTTNASAVAVGVASAITLRSWTVTVPSTWAVVAPVTSAVGFRLLISSAEKPSVSTSASAVLEDVAVRVRPSAVTFDPPAV